MKFRYEFLLYIFLFTLPAVACGEEITPTSSSRSSSVEIPSPTSDTSSYTPAPEFPPIPTPTPKPNLPLITIKGTRVNIRSGPGTNYPIIQTLDQNDTAPATGFNTEQTWVQIELSGSTLGWVSADLVDIDNSDDIAIVTNIPSAPVATTSSQQPPSTESENSGDSSENVSAPVVTTSSQQPPSSDNNGDSSNVNSGNPFQCTGGCATPPDPSCAIKGNVNSSHDKIYHVPSGAFYDRTDINPDEGDRWFCTTAEAEAAGFRPSER